VRLADVPRRRRCGAVLHLMAANPGLSVEERSELLAVAVGRPT
jgi:hypothetical protein